MLVRYREMAFLNKGVYIKLADRREEEIVNELYYEGGIVSFVKYLDRSKQALHGEPVYINVEKDGSIVEIALQYNDSYAETLFSYANNIATMEGGMHVTGFKSALTKVLNDYARKIGAVKDNENNLQGEDTREV
jgi:DNA gyrase subunit B